MSPLDIVILVGAAIGAAFAVVQILYGIGTDLPGIWGTGGPERRRPALISGVLTLVGMIFVLAGVIINAAT